MLGTAGPAVRINPGNGGEARVFGKRGALSCHLLSGQGSRQTGPGGRCPWRWRTPRRLPAGSLAPQTRAALPPSSPSGTWGAARGARQPLWAPKAARWGRGRQGARSQTPDVARGSQGRLGIRKLPASNRAASQGSHAASRAGLRVGRGRAPAQVPAQVQL